MSKENGFEVKCNKCGYAWRFTGAVENHWASCPRCRNNCAVIKPLVVYPGESIPVQSFLGFWQSARRPDQGFDGFMLSDEYRELVSTLETLRSKTHTLLAPTTSSLYPSVEEPAAWHAAVDPDFISEAEEIANEIAVKKLSLQSLREGISQFVEIAEGPTVQPIETKRGNAERRLQRLYSVAQKEEIAQIKRGKLGQSPETLNPKLQSATEALRLEESELKATAADCTARVQACYKIIQSRESIAAVPVPKADVVTVKEENVEA